MTGTRLRWVASGALAVVAVILAASMLLDGAPAASGDSGDLGTPQASTPASTDPTSGKPSAADPTPESSADSSTGASSAPQPSDPVATTVDPAAGPPLRPDVTLGLGVAPAEALARFYVGQAVNYLKLTGDGAAVRAVSSPMCKPCHDEIPLFVETNGRNKRLSGDYLWKNLEVRAVRSTGSRSAVVDVDATRGRHLAIEKAGPKSYPGGKVSLELTLVAEGNDWKIFDLGLR